MRSLTKYIMKQAMAPLIMFTLVLTVLVWLTQSLQMLDLMINRQQSTSTYILMTLYVLPSLLTVILPFALFCASLFILHRLSTDSELVVMSSAGVSPMAIARPMFVLAVVVAIINLLLNLYLMPSGYREMKDTVFEIRSDIATNMIRDGQFTNPMPGLTVYNRKTSREGVLQNLLIHDNRDKEQPRTYIAKTGKFVKAPEGSRLIMKQVLVQRLESSGNLSVMTSQEYPLDITQFLGDQQPEIVRDLTERYLHELLMPDMNQRWDTLNKGRLLAEGHNRLASPLYNFLFVLIALCATLAGSFNRRGYASRIAIALVIGLVIRLLGFGIQSLASNTPALVVYQYLIPIFFSFCCAYILFELKPLMKEFFGEPAKSPLTQN